MKRLFALLLFFVLVTAGCQKENVDSKIEESGNGKLIRMISVASMDGYDANMYNLHFVYDDNEKLIEIKFIYEEETENLTFTYFGSEVYYDYEGGSILKFEDERVVSFENEYVTEKYHYDANGMLNQKQYTSGNKTYTTIYERSEGNIIKIYGPNGGVEAISYSDYEDKMNLDLWEFYASGPIIAEFTIDRKVFKNIGSTELPTFIKTKYGDTIEISYEFDKDGYPVKIKSVWSDGSSEDYIRILTINY